MSWFESVKNSMSEHVNEVEHAHELHTMWVEKVIDSLNEIAEISSSHGYKLLPYKKQDEIRYVKSRLIEMWNTHYHKISDLEHTLKGNQK